MQTYTFKNKIIYHINETQFLLLPNQTPPLVSHNLFLNAKSQQGLEAPEQILDDRQASLKCPLWSVISFLKMRSICLSVWSLVTVILMKDMTDIQIGPCAQGLQQGN